MQTVHSLGNCEICINNEVSRTKIHGEVFGIGQTNYPLRLLPFPGTFVSVSGSKQPAGRGACETTVS